MPTRPHVTVVGAVVVRDGLVLCAQRGPEATQAGLWEFPGGKVEAAEEPRAALVREIREELGCTLLAGDEVTTTTHPYDALTVTLTTYWCTVPDHEVPVAHEHAALRWVAPDELGALSWAPADVSAVRVVQERLAAAYNERA